MVANSGTPKIRPIDRAAVHRICSGQVVLDLATAVKELVENSLDAGATNVEIRLKEYGSALIEVADNGSGVSPDNYEGLTLKYYTSKISEFADLQTLSSFGFRGEALSSLCALSNVSVTTRTKEEAVGTRLEYDHSGVITLQESVARAVGTTVAVSKLFSPLPVRYKEFNRNIRREYGRLLSVLQAYALIAKGVRIVCTNQVGKGGRTTIVQTQGSNSVKDNIITIFGSKTAACLEPLVLSVSDDCRLEGFVSRPGAGCGRASGDRQFCYVNGRPVDLPKINRLLNELYGSFNSLQKPMAVLNFLLSPTAYDVNVTPDKRKVFLHMESDFLVALKEALEKVYTPDNYSYTINSLDPKSLKGRAGAVELEAENLHITSSEYIQELDTSAEINDSEETEGSPTQDKALTPGPFLTFEQNTPLKSGFLDLVSFKLKGPGSTRNGKGKLAIAGGHSSSRDVTARSNPPKILQSQLTRFVTPSKRIDRTEESNEVAAVWDNVEVKELDIVKQSQEESSPVEASAEDIISLVETPQDRAVSCADDNDDDESHPAPVIIKPKLVIGLDQEESLVETPQDRSVSCADDDNDDECHPAPVIIKPKLVIGLDQEESCTIKVPEEGILTNDMDMQQFPVELEEDDDVTPMDIEKSMDDGVNKDCTVGVPSSSQINPAVLPFDLQKLQGKAKRRLVQHGDESMRPKKNSKRMRGFNAATLGADGVTKDGAEKEAALIAATKELELSFSKSDFRHMKVADLSCTELVIGQFNLGFILARLDQDLFIVDQHASDEKYNFERLSKTTVLNKQPLIRPLLVDLSAAEEIIVTTHIETFRQNGFDFVEEDNAPPGRRLRLSAVPFSKNITFGVGDVQELVGILANESAPIAWESPGSLRRCNQLLSVVRPSRVRSMLASRACRSSIMIGDSLSKKEMEKVLCHLTDLDAPWNCPHGRPTMRHLADLTGLHQR